MDGFPRRILLATDGSEAADLAARAAIDLSEKGGSELHVAHAWHDVPTPHLHSLVRAQLRQEAEEVLRRQVENIERAGGTVAEAHLREGRTIDEILDLSEELEAGLLVVGSRGLGGARRILLGSVSEGIVHHARRPVLVTRGGENAWPPARIVVADDSSEDARRAGELAAGIGKLVGARVVLVRVYPGGLEFSPEGEDALRQGERDLEDRASELEGLLGRRPQTEIRTGAGDPAAAILEAAEEGEAPTLVAFGSRGLGKVRREVGERCHQGRKGGARTRPGLPAPMRHTGLSPPPKAGGIRGAGPRVRVARPRSSGPPGPGFRAAGAGLRGPGARSSVGRAGDDDHHRGGAIGGPAWTSF